MWFELSNRIDNMKFILMNTLPRIGFENEIKYKKKVPFRNITEWYKVIAMVALLDKQTN